MIMKDQKFTVPSNGDIDFCVLYFLYCSKKLESI